MHILALFSVSTDLQCLCSAVPGADARRLGAERAGEAVRDRLLPEAGDAGDEHQPRRRGRAGLQQPAVPRRLAEQPRAQGADPCRI